MTNFKNLELGKIVDIENCPRKFRDKERERNF